jgi:hypothetical protein
VQLDAERGVGGVVRVGFRFNVECEPEVGRAFIARELRKLENPAWLTRCVFHHDQPVNDEASANVTPAM